MNIITEITEQDINPEAPMIDPLEFDRREAVRAVVMNDSGQIALLNVSKRGFHKLPGGGIEPGEGKVKALAREVLEEVGCVIEIIEELGAVIEYRDEWHQVQTSFCYFTKQVGRQRQNALTDAERADGFEIVWSKNLDDAIALLEADSPNGYDGRRMKPRDLAILKAAKKRLVQT